LLNFVLSLAIWFGFDNSVAGFQMVEKSAWIGTFMSYHLGVDGISMLFIILTTFLMPFCILASWESVQDRVREYMVAFLLLERTSRSASPASVRTPAASSSTAARFTRCTPKPSATPSATPATDKSTRARRCAKRALRAMKRRMRRV
jgi:hypothetical protein